MNLGLALSVFGVIFLAELPDKTMIATLIMGSRGRAAAVWVGASLAFIVHMAFAAIAGGLLDRLPHRALEIGVTAMFFAVAAYLLLIPEKEAVNEGEEEAGAERAGTALATMASAFMVILVAETGDLTQIIAASFTLKSHQPLTVFLASSAALVSVAAIGAFGGKALLKVLPLARIRQLGGIVLLILGIVGIVQMLTSCHCTPHAAMRRSEPMITSSSPERLASLLAFARAARGFMPDDEGLSLHEAGLEGGRRFPGGSMLEVGAWCGKSGVYLGAAAEATGSVLFSLDHHHGSEENQAGWEHHDADLVDPADGRLNTLPTWQRTIADAELEHSVVGLVGDSLTVAAHFATPLAFLFIDGGHGEEPAWADYRAWTPKVQPNGILAIHDVFEDPADGGRPPYELYCEAIRSEIFTELWATGSLRVLERRSS